MWTGPVAVQQFRVDIFGGAVDVDIAAREMGVQKGDAVIGRGGEEVFDVFILGGFKRVKIAGKVEIIGVAVAAVGAVKNQR